jgi:hypothetical protein
LQGFSHCFDIGEWPPGTQLRQPPPRARQFQTGLTAAIEANGSGLN